MAATIKEVLLEVQGINRRLDKMNGKIEEHEKRLGEHDVRLAELGYEEKHHSVNWDRLISLGLGILQAVIIYLLLNGH